MTAAAIRKALLRGDVAQATEIAQRDARTKAESRARRKSYASMHKAAGKEAEHAATADLRVAVFARCGGYCEACRVELGVSWDMHHVLSGGQRRSRQRLSNVVALCWECHRRAHRGDLGTLAQIAQVPGLDAEAQAAVRRRIEKIERMRRTPSVPIRVEVREPRTTTEAAERFLDVMEGKP